jgi:hypothetical protein
LGREEEEEKVIAALEDEEEAENRNVDGEDGRRI